jgi:hypothetical protein
MVWRPDPSWLTTKPAVVLTLWWLVGLLQCLLCSLAVLGSAANVTGLWRCGQLF